MFAAGYCRKCMAMKPKYARIAQGYENKVMFLRYAFSIDSSPECLFSSTKRRAPTQDHTGAFPKAPKAPSSSRKHQTPRSSLQTRSRKSLRHSLNNTKSAVMTPRAR